MSLTSISSLSFNTLANYAACLCGIEKAFVTILKRKSPPIIFRDNSFTGRAINQCLDISHYLLGAALFLSPAFQWSASSRIAASILILPVPLFCKAICQMVSSKSATYRFSDHAVQVVRVGVKLGFVIAAIKTLRHRESGAELLEVVQAAGFLTAFVLDASTTFNYLMCSLSDFYLHRRWSYP